MGLGSTSSRIIVIAVSLCAAVFSFSVGDQSRAADQEVIGYLPSLHFFSGHELRRELTEAIYQGQTLADSDLPRRLAETAPMDPLLYELKLLEAVSGGDTEKAELYAEQVLSVQPRSLAARLQLFNSATKRNDFKAVFEHYEGLVRLRSLNNSLLTNALIGIFRENGDWKPLLEYMKSEPLNGEALTRKLLLEAIPIADITPIVSNYPEVKAHFLKRLMRDGLKDQAHMIWKSFAGIKDKDQVALPFNGAFADRDEPPPFNWSMLYERAEIQPTGGLYVSYLGRGQPIIVQQVMTAPAGEYVLKTEAKGRMEGKVGSLEWVIACHGDPTPIAHSRIHLTRPTVIETFESEVMIPLEACDYQTLQLRGRPGEFPKTSRAELLSVTMMPAN